MRCHCGYMLVNGVCPICGGRQIKGVEPRAMIPRSLRQQTNIPQHFETLRHYYAWRAGIGLEGEGRRKVRARDEEIVRRAFKNRCQWPGGCSSNEYPTLEHIRPVAFGGSNHPANLTLLCSAHQRTSWQRFEQLCVWDGAA